MCRPPRLWTLTLALVSAVALAASPVDAADYFVTPNGSGSACLQASPCALSTAISAAGSGDTIYVGAGTYTGTGAEVVLLDTSVKVLGGWDGAPSGAVRRDRIAYPSVLDGQNARRVVTITGSGSANPTVDGFTITRGDATGAIADCSGASADPPFGCGGGIFVYDAGPTISNNLIVDNVAASSASGPQGSGYGGGIYAVYPAGVVIFHNTIRGNTATKAGNGLGGGIGIYTCLAECRVEANRIVDNVAGTAQDLAAFGGGLALTGWTDHPVVVEENLLRGNQATAVGFAQGDDLYTWYAAFEMHRNCVWSSHGAEAVYLGHVNGVFEANTVLADASRGALTVHDLRQSGDELRAENNIIAGGGDATLDVSGGQEDPLPVSLIHNTIVGSGLTIGVNIYHNVDVTFADNIVAGHDTGITVSDGATADIDHALFWNNTSNGEAGEGAVIGDPLFVNAPRGDYHIQTGSAAIGAGVDAGVAADIDGEARPGAGGFDIGADELAPRSFDFGTAASPVAAGYTQVTNATVYEAARGFGWLSGAIASRDRGAGTDLTRDLCFTTLGAFAVDVPNGRYTVAVTMGDAAAGHSQMGVFLEGVQVASVSTAGNEFKTISADVSVGDGQLTVLLDDLGGSDVNVVVNALTITPAVPLRLDLGTPSSPVAEGYRRVSHLSTYSQAAGFGWRGGIIQSRDRGIANPVTRDLDFTRLGLFGVYLQNGIYDVMATFGDAASAHDQMGVSVQGSAPEAITTAKNQFDTRVWRTAVSDNGLGALLDDLGGSDVNVVVNSIAVLAPPPLRLDFGTATSPVHAGYLKVTDASDYSASRGYGWVSGAVAARDRGGYGQLLSDFNFTNDGTFVVDVLPGRYTVTFSMGDATNAHDQMGVYVEDVLVATQSFGAGEFGTFSITTAVVDGQLTVRLVDLGGADRNVVINGLEIR